MGRKKVKVLVEFALPDGVGTVAAMSYIVEAIASWKGGMVDDPMTELDIKSIRTELTKARFTKHPAI